MLLSLSQTWISRTHIPLCAANVTLHSPRLVQNQKQQDNWRHSCFKIQLKPATDGCHLFHHDPADLPVKTVIILTENLPSAGFSSCSYKLRQPNANVLFSEVSVCRSYSDHCWWLVVKKADHMSILCDMSVEVFSFSTLIIPRSCFQYYSSL